MHGMEGGEVWREEHGGGVEGGGEGEGRKGEVQ
jgi:hypothetical protein